MMEILENVPTFGWLILVKKQFILYPLIYKNIYWEPTIHSSLELYNHRDWHTKQTEKYSFPSKYSFQIQFLEEETKRNFPSKHILEISSIH